MIRTEGLVHRYGDVTAVDGVSLTVEDGSFLVVAGANERRLAGAVRPRHHEK